MKKVGIVLVNYKTYVNQFLADCRDGLRQQNYPQESIMVYIVDNASSDESVKYIKDCYPEAVIIPRPDGNYAAANNAGIAQAKLDNCDYVVISNMDVKFDNNWLVELVKAIEVDSQVGIAQSKILLCPKTSEEEKHLKINSIGNAMHFLGFGYTLGYKEDDREIAGYPEIPGYASGCSYICTLEVLNKINNYDEEYYMYHDDIEMSWKVKLAGYKIVLAPKSIIYHKYEFSRSIRMVYYMERNRYLAMFHYYKITTLILISPAIIAMECGMLFYSIINGWFTTKMKVMGYFLQPTNWKKIINKRHLVKRIRTIGDKNIVKNFTGEVLFQEINNPVLKYIANPLLNLYWKIVKNIIIW